MSRLAYAALCATVLAACKVERTPTEFIDHQEPVAVARDAAVEELQDRLLALGQALNRGDADEALQALSPAPEAYVVASDGPAVLTGEEEIGGALRRFADRPGETRLRDVRVTVGPRASVAWFRAELEHPGEPAPPLRLTGVFLRGDEGGWRLVQAHLSSISPVPAPAPPSPGGVEAPPAGG